MARLCLQVPGLDAYGYSSDAGEDEIGNEAREPYRGGDRLVLETNRLATKLKNYQLTNRLIKTLTTYSTSQSILMM
ncbi:hypothetical protein P152DRAFT_461721, partial [Eremomyces bilateralis CBS 781.70]